MGDIGSTFSEDVLSGVEREEYNSFNHRRRKDEFLSTRGIIKKLAADLGMDQTKFEIRKDGLGKPFGIYHNSRYNLSLAHTGQKVICGLSPTIPIGLDIEPIARRVDERLRNRILHEDEHRKLADVPVLRLWTLKEALVKLNGQGLRTDLKTVRIAVEEDQVFSGKFDNEKSAIICSFQHCDHWIAVAYYQ